MPSMTASFIQLTFKNTYSKKWWLGVSKPTYRNHYVYRSCHTYTTSFKLIIETLF